MPHKFRKKSSCKMVRGIGIIVLLAYIFVGVPYVYWRNAQDAGVKQETEMEELESNSEGKVSSQSLLGNEIDLNTVLFDGNTDTEENPWGTTAGIISIENIGECIFLTPNTSAELELENVDEKEIVFNYEIYSQVREASDGADIRVEVFLNGEESASIIENFAVSTDKDWSEARIAIEEGNTENLRIKISCGNGGKDNDNADWVIIKLNENQNTTHTEIVKAVTYFGDAWPINFWNSEIDNLQEDFDQIVEDGFNAIILVIPWREFQPTVSPITYNNRAFEMLDQILEQAESFGLKVYTRVGYTWDYYDIGNETIRDRYYNILGDQNTKEAWKQYLEKLYDLLSKYQNFSGAFITWEDFWTNMELPKQIGGTNESCEVGEYIGYIDYLKNNYAIEEVSTIYQKSYDDYSEIEIPDYESMAMKLWYEFYDSFLIELLEESQQYFPDLSMEVRNDWDVYYDENGDPQYYEHNSTYSCGNASYTAVMYGIPQGNKNEGERLTAEEAIGTTEYILNDLKNKNTAKPIFVEQFIFYDNTPGFEQNAKLMEEEINEYLDKVDEVLEKYTMGYGIWTYKNYKSNLVYNADFAVGLDGWEVLQGDVESYETDGSKKIILQADSIISQKIPAERVQFPAEEYTFELEVFAEESATITIQVGEESQTFDVIGTQTIRKDFSDLQSYDIQIISSDSIVIDKVFLYNQVQEGLLYDSEGNELLAIEGIRELNKQLE